MAKIGEVYGSSMYSVAKEINLQKEIFGELSEVDKLLKDNQDFYSLIGAPVLSKLEKQSVIDKVFGNSVNALVLNFLKLLIDNDRIKYLDEVVEGYKKTYYANENIIEVEVVSHVKLDEKQLNQIKKSIELKSKKQVDIKTVVDKSIIGGLIIKTDNKQIFLKR